MEVRHLMSIIKNKKGFTLIELVIVLAIAALILAAILIAVSGAQKSRRDTQRKDDVTKIVSYLEQSASNNSGNYPTGVGVGAFNTSYLPTATSKIKDPSSGTVYLLHTTTGSQDGKIKYVLGKNCAGAALGTRVYSLSYALEQGGTYCTDNQ